MALKEIHEKKIVSLPAKKHVNSIGLDESVQRILDGSSMVIHSIETLGAREEYPCQIIDIPQLQ